MGSGDDEDYGDDEAFVKHVVGAFLCNDCISCLQDGLIKLCSLSCYQKGPTEDEERSQLDPAIEERKRLKSLALSRNLLSNAPSKPISPLTPSNLILKHQGRDIVKKVQRKNIFLFSFLGLLAPVSAGKIGELKDIGTKNPVLYIDFPQGWMKLFGTIVYPKNKYLTLQFARGEKKVTCEDCFENMERLKKLKAEHGKKKPLLRVTTGVFHGRQLLDERDLHFITIELTRHAYHSAWHIMKKVNVEGPNSALPFPQVEALPRTIPLASHLRKRLTLTTPPPCFGGACNTNRNDSGTGSCYGPSSSSRVFDNNSDSERGGEEEEVERIWKEESKKYHQQESAKLSQIACKYKSYKMQIGGLVGENFMWDLLVNFCKGVANNCG
ncbi:hypothetical protein MRB53_026628 [Persea americana]|uniref:Uncharacterized protein n=1 Tax=Persea americana TaxID=3435 RepID=A0ACC2LIR2_PERAE|nr:hypothetical protein MRB53_026628 [Persea americana]